MHRALVTCLLVLCLGAASAVGASAATGGMAKAKAVAVKAVGGGRAISAERRSNGRGWEVYVRRAGSTYEVKLSPAFAVLKVQRQGVAHDQGDDHGGGHG